MKKHTLKYLVKQAYKGRGQMDSACSEIFNIIYEMIDIEDTGDLHVFIQDGDGLVLCWDAHNTPTKFIVRYFNIKKRKLNAEDLLEISI